MKYLWLGIPFDYGLITWDTNGKNADFLTEIFKDNIKSNDVEKKERLQKIKSKKDQVDDLIQNDLKYNFYNKYLWRILAILTFLALFLLFVDISSDYITEKKAENANNKDNDYMNLNNYLKLNIEYFEKEFFSHLEKSDEEEEEIFLNQSQNQIENLSQPSNCSFANGLMI